jgi:hypothetical protein
MIPIFDWKPGQYFLYWLVLSQGAQTVRSRDLELRGGVGSAPEHLNILYGARYHFISQLPISNFQFALTVSMKLAAA